MAYRMGLLGKKVGMTQKFDEKGVWQALCVLEMGPCVVLDVLTPERNGYSAIQIGFGEGKERNTRKPQLGQFARAKTTPKRFIREIRLDPSEIGKFSVGQTVSVSEVFRRGDRVDITGTSKGKGFQGVIKRYHFSGFRATHGTHEYFRHGGSIGCRLTPGRVFKGQRMPGQLGNKQITVQNVQVVDVMPERNLLLLAGGVPGSPDGYLVVQQAVKYASRGFVATPVAEPAAPAPELEVEAPAQV